MPEPLLKLWPAHPRPLEDELLSSWVLRVAQANGRKLREFYHQWVGRGATYIAMDVDLRAPDELVQVMARKTGRSPQSVASMALTGLEGLVFEDIDAQRHPDWILARCAPGAAAGQRASLQYCPGCLGEGHAPYFRRTWRLAWATACERHRMWLLDRCACCRAPVQLQRLTVGRQTAASRQLGLARCEPCGADLRAAADGVSSAPVPAPALWLQALCERAQRQGFIDLAGNPNLHSLAFFSGLRHIASGLWRHEFAGRSRESRHQRVRLEWASLADRQGVMSRTAEILQAWPQSFFEATRAMPSPYSHFTREARSRPFWFEQAYAELGRRSAPISANELAAIKDVVVKKEGVFTPSAAYRLYGRNLFFPTRHETFVRPVREDDVELLMATLDHRISLARGRLRLELLRDKMLFLTARVLSLKKRDLVMASVQAPWIGEADEERPRIGWTLPGDAQAIRPWLWWYIAKVRPAFKGAAGCSALFLSQTHGRAMSKALVALRFSRAVQDAGLSSRLDFKTWIGAAHGQSPHNHQNPTGGQRDHT